MKPLPKRYDFFEHTADAGIQVYGRTLGELFSNAGTALFEFMADISSVKDDEERRLELRCFDREELFVRWLSELLFLHEVQGLLLNRFDIRFVRGGMLKANVRGAYYSSGIHQIFNQVKAVTYHQIEITRSHGLWIARVILDL